MLCQYLQSRQRSGLSSPYCSALSQTATTPDLSFLLTKFKNFSTDEYSTMDNEGMCVPPLACSFAKMYQHQHVVGIVDEDGFLVLYNTHKTGQASVIKTWQVHTNAVFDMEWFQQEHKILTGSGDQTIALHDIETCSKLDTFKGHASSVKSISCRATDDAVFVSGSRDGHIMMWDKRVSHKEGAVPPVNTIYNAHMLQQQNTPQGKQKKKRPSLVLRDAQQSVTSVLFQNENYIVSAGAVDGCLKVWDIRKTYKVKLTAAAPVHVFSYPGTNSRKHGYTSLVQDSRHMRLFASCTDDVIYEYDIASYNPKPVQSWRGHKNSTFYVKTAISPDDQFLLSGSSDECAYIWQINKPHSSPILLKSHSAEVTSVAWCPNDMTKLVTLSDDTKIKFWRIYCREIKDNLLPECYGQAARKKIERATSTETKETRTPVRPGSLPASPATTTQKTPRLTSSPQSFIHTWLKRKSSSQASSPQEDVDTKLSSSGVGESVNSSTCDVTSCNQSNRPNNSAQLSCTCNTLLESSSRFTEPKPCDAPEQSSSGVRAHTCMCPQCGKEKKISQDSLTPHSTVPSVCDLPENVLSKRDFSSVTQEPTSPCKKPAVGAASSPSKKGGLFSNKQQEAENLSPQKIKRSLASSESPASTPKRKCLTRIEPNTHSIKVNLFNAGSSAADSNSGSDSIDSKTSETNPDAVLKTESQKNTESNVNESTPRSPLPPLLGCEQSDVTPVKCDPAFSDISAFKASYDSDEDFNSPTRNLPNLVLDQVTGGLGHSPLAKVGQARDGPTLKTDWLTRLRLEKKKKAGDSPKQASLVSPKVAKGMKKIQSYFKPKN